MPCQFVQGELLHLLSSYNVKEIIIIIIVIRIIIIIGVKNEGCMEIQNLPVKLLVFTQRYRTVNRLPIL